MNSVQIKIDDRLVPVEFVWVHLQPARPEESHGYTIAVPVALAGEIFGRYPDGTSIESEIQRLIADLGTFIVDGYLNNIRRCENAPWAPFRWVIATVGEVSNERDNIVIRGIAIPFHRDTRHES